VGMAEDDAVRCDVKARREERVVGWGGIPRLLHYLMVRFEYVEYIYDYLSSHVLFCVALESPRLIGYPPSKVQLCIRCHKWCSICFL